MSPLELFGCERLVLASHFYLAVPSPEDLLVVVAIMVGFWGELFQPSF